ncbi:DUF3102 domain-containing protein [Zhengella sp. ZM62]
MSIDNVITTQNEEDDLITELTFDVPCATASLPESAPDRFHYEGVDEPDADEIRDAAARIRERHTNIVKNILATGKDLLMVKNKLKHGAFRQWLEADFGWSERTAQNYMQAARVFGGMAHAVEALAPASIYKLSARNTPEAVRESVINDIDKGNTPTAKDIDERIKAAKLARAARNGTNKGTTPAPSDLTAMEASPDSSILLPDHGTRAADVAGILRRALGSEFPIVAHWLSNISGDELAALKHALSNDVVEDIDPGPASSGHPDGDPRAQPLAV